jgi:hypothetical protein
MPNMLNSIFKSTAAFYFLSTHFSSREDNKVRRKKTVGRIFKMLFGACLRGRNMLLVLSVSKVVC